MHPSPVLYWTPKFLEPKLLQNMYILIYKGMDICKTTQRNIYMCTLQLGPTHAMHEFVDKHSNLDRLVKHVPHGCSGKEPLILAERYIYIYIYIHV